MGSCKDIAHNDFDIEEWNRGKPFDVVRGQKYKEQGWKETKADQTDIMHQNIGDWITSVIVGSKTLLGFTLVLSIRVLKWLWSPEYGLKFHNSHI